MHTANIFLVLFRCKSYGVAYHSFFIQFPCVLVRRGYALDNESLRGVLAVVPKADHPNPNPNPNPNPHPNPNPDPNPNPNAMG